MPCGAVLYPLLRAKHPSGTVLSSDLQEKEPRLGGSLLPLFPLQRGDKQTTRQFVSRNLKRLHVITSLAFSVLAGLLQGRFAGWPFLVPQKTALSNCLQRYPASSAGYIQTFSVRPECLQKITMNTMVCNLQRLVSSSDYRPNPF